MPLSIILFYVYLLFFNSFISNAHECMHNYVRTRIEDLPLTETPREFVPESDKPLTPIRVKVDFSNLDDDVTVCTAPGQSRVQITGNRGTNTLICEYWNVLTSEMKDSIKKKIVPIAVDMISRSYLINKSNEVILNPDTVSGCGVTKNGIGPVAADTDFVVFVAASVLDFRSKRSIAYAYSCGRAQSNRPTIAVINFNANFLYVGDDYNISSMVKTAFHELHHGMGFTNLLAISKPVTKRGKTVHEIQSPNVLRSCKDYFGCENITGLEIEDEGSAGSQYVHWDRRIAFEELMCSAGGSKITNFTFAFMEDLGYYKVNYSAAPVESLLGGKKAGCNFLNQKCNLVEGGKGKYWFFDQDDHCTMGYMSIGQGSWQDQGSPIEPSYFVYDPARPTYGGGIFTDQCPYTIRYSDYGCAWDKDDNKFKDYGFVFSSKSRCFGSDSVRDKDFIKSKIVQLPVKFRCFKARCPAGGNRIEAMVGDKWSTCPLDGSEATVDAPYGFTGKISCPSATDFCDNFVSLGEMPHETVPLESNIPENRDYNQVTGGVVFNGTWTSVHDDIFSRINFTIAFRVDFGNYLTVGSANIRVRRISFLPNDEMQVLFSIVANSDYYITTQALSMALKKILYNREKIPNIINSFSSISPGQTTVVVDYSVDDIHEVNICRSLLTPDKCLFMIGMIIILGSSLIVFIFMYCICLRSPFDEPPIPPRINKNL